MQAFVLDQPISPTEKMRRHIAGIINAYYRVPYLSRLIHLLLEFHDRLKANGSVEDGSFIMPFTQEVLSDALGLSTVHTNRILQQLRRERLIETHAATVRLIDPVLLAEIADYRTPARLG